MILNKYFSFGGNAGQIKVFFTWYDSFSEQKVESSSAIMDALSSKFNYGVCLAKIACYMELNGDGIKYACKYM